MIDIDALTRRFGNLISQYCIISSIIYSTDKHQRTKSYEESVFAKNIIVKITLDTSQKNLELMLVTTNKIKIQQELEKNAEAHISLE